MPMLSVAPEGTLSHGRCVLKFKTGAFVAGCPVVPFVLRYKLVPHNPAWTVIIPFWHVVSALVSSHGGREWAATSGCPLCGLKTWSYCITNNGCLFYTHTPAPTLHAVPLVV